MAMTLTPEDLAAIEQIFCDALEAHGLKRKPKGNAERQRRYRERQRGTDGSHCREEWMARVAFHGWRCRYCGVRLDPETLVKEHAIPLSRGGTNWPANLVPSCGACNRKKGTKTAAEYLRLVG